MFLSTLSSFSQNNTAKPALADTTTDPVIDMYDKYNSTIGGDSVRYQNGKKCEGEIIDYYSNGKIKHRGFYNEGRLTQRYKNFYETGETERVFQAQTARKSTMLVYYKNQKLKSRVFYFKGNPIQWEDFYKNGLTEFYEEYNKEFEYYISKKNYYDNGNLEESLELIDKKNMVYNSKLYYKNGQLKEEGKIIYNQTIKDYTRTDNWLEFDKNGKMIAEKYYINGSLYSEKKF